MILIISRDLASEMTNEILKKEDMTLVVLND